VHAEQALDAERTRAPDLHYGFVAHRGIVGKAAGFIGDRRTGQRDQPEEAGGGDEAAEAARHHVS
jgi:hypothetical protein